MGWIQFEPDSGKRKKFMDEYFKTVLEGYRSETRVDDSMVEQLPLFIQATLMENIAEQFKDMRDNGEEPNCGEELSYLLTCLESECQKAGPLWSGEPINSDSRSVFQ
jgi:hypothetical protein